MVIEFTIHLNHLFWFFWFIFDCYLLQDHHACPWNVLAFVFLQFLLVSFFPRLLARVQLIFISTNLQVPIFLIQYPFSLLLILYLWLSFFPQNISCILLGFFSFFFHFHQYHNSNHLILIIPFSCLDFQISLFHVIALCLLFFPISSSHHIFFRILRFYLIHKL